MLKRIAVICLSALLFIFPVGNFSAFAEEKETEQESSSLSQEEKEIVEMMELLELMELLRNMELLSDYDIIRKDEKDENNG